LRKARNSIERARPDPVEESPGGQVQRGEHVHHAVVAVVGRPQPARLAAGPPGFALARQQVQRPELVHVDHPAVAGWVVIEVEDPARLGDEVRVGGGLPGGRGLPRDTALAQDPAQRLPADRRDDALGEQVIAELGQ
jgi:hypothetical protein